MKYEVQTVDVCPVCGNSSDKNPMVYGAVYRNMFYIQYRLCSECSCRYLDPCMSDEATIAYYKNDYREVVGGEKKANDRDVDIQRFRSTYFYHLYNRYCPSKGNGKVLDIGTSSGATLDGFHEGGIDKSLLEGVELCEEDRDIAQSKGYLVHEELPDQDYELVTMGHVLEHYNDPHPVLQWVKNHAQYLILEVPNADATMHAYLMHHPVAYTEASLVNLYKQFDMAPLIHTKHSGVFRLPVHMYITMVLEV